MRKIFKFFSVILIFILLFINCFSFVFAQTTTPTNPPTPTPTYALFQDTGSGGINIGNSIEKALLDSGLNCGNIGQICCGKVIIPDINNFVDAISGSLFSSIPGLARVSAFILPLVGRFLISFFNTIGGLPQKILPVETRSYCVQGYPSNDRDPERCTCVSSDNLAAGRLCGVLASNSEQNECFNNCMKNGQGVWTALGCFSSDLSTLIKEKVFGFGIGLAGFISLMCIIYSAFQLQTSQGSAEKIKKAQELLTSCIMGLMLIIFSVFILRLIGVDILKIPGFVRK